MKKETCESILRAYDQIFAYLGFPEFSSGIRYICAAMETHTEGLRKARNRNGVLLTLMKEPEPDPEKLDAILKAIHLLPSQLRTALPQAAKEAVQKLPQNPGGRKSKLEAEDRKHVCEEIGRLLVDGLSLRDAEMRVAQRRGVSVTTIARAWQKRRRIPVGN